MLNQRDQLFEQLPTHAGIALRQRIQATDEDRQRLLIVQVFAQANKLSVISIMY